jgi:hypothetical protein
MPPHITPIPPRQPALLENQLAKPVSGFPTCSQPVFPAEGFFCQPPVVCRMRHLDFQLRDIFSRVILSLMFSSSPDYHSFSAPFCSSFLSASFLADSRTSSQTPRALI